MVLGLRRLYWTVLVSVLALSSCAQLGPSLDSTERPPASTPTGEPTAVSADTRRTPTPSRAANPSSTPTLAPTASQAIIQPPLPDVLLNVGSDMFPLNVCTRYVSPAQVWVAHYPYTRADPLLADDATGFYYPVWSPDGQWIAYMVSSPRQPVETVGEDALMRRFVESDSVWVMRPDGSDKRRVSDKFTRVEMEMAAGGCTPVGGVSSLRGWSPDSRWLAFVGAPPEDDTDSILYVVNVETGESIPIPGEIGSLAWSAKNNTLAVVLYEGERAVGSPVLEIIAIERSGLSRQRLDPDVEFPPGYFLEDIHWTEDDRQVVVLGYSLMQDARFSVWEVEISTGEWTQRVDLGIKPSVVLRRRDQRAVVCYPSGRMTKLDVYDMPDWGIVGVTYGPEGMDCRTLGWLNDAVGNVASSFVVPTEDWEAVGVGTIGLIGTPQRLLSRNSLGFPVGLRLVSLSWQP